MRSWLVMGVSKSKMRDLDFRVRKSGRVGGFGWLSL